MNKDIELLQLKTQVLELEVQALKLMSAYPYIWPTLPQPSISPWGYPYTQPYITFS